MSERAQQPQIVQMTTEEFVQTYKPEVIDRFVQENGEALANAYTGDEAFSQVVGAPPELGFRASDILVASQNGALVALLQPLIYSILPSVLKKIPVHLQQAALEAAATSTCIGFGPMVVDNAFKRQGIATALLQHCIGKYFPQTIMQLRQRVSEVITPRDIDLHSDDKNVNQTVIKRVTSSLDRPLFFVESEHPWLLQRMREIIGNFQDLYVQPKNMTEIEFEIANVLMSSMLTGGLRQEQEGRISKFHTQIRIPYAEDVSVNYRRVATCGNLDGIEPKVIAYLHTLGLTTNVIESIKEVQFTSPRINLEERDELHAMFEAIAAELGLTVSSADETVYRSVVGTRF